ncbi:MAG: MFS transporter, partial [Actinobacteria bacterium]|nr:MFS transporter [Actinomycetota bacterium]
GASFIYAPALGVWLYNYSDWLGFGLIVALCLVVFAYGSRALQADSTLTLDRR